MQREHQTILPKRSFVEDDVDEVEEVDESKRSRIGVNVACNSCRGRKIRCDGLRPTCSNCQSSTKRCTYRDEGGLSAESSRLVLEVFSILNQLPLQETIQMTHGINDGRSAWAIILALRAARNDHLQSTDGSSAIDPMLTSSPPEFQLQYPTAYPLTSGPSTEVWATKSYQELIKPVNQASSSTTDGRHGALIADPSVTVLDKNEQSASLPRLPLLHRLCDPRLARLEISYWTDVEIDNDLAARCISLYLETDHPLLAPFDPDLFIEHLIEREEQFCSPLLVNALLYWACVRSEPEQMYSAIDDSVDPLALKFCKEAESLWETAQNEGNDSINHIAAAELLSLGYLGHGRDHSVLKYSTEAARMGARMGLFGVIDQSQSAHKDDTSDTVEMQRPRSYAAWGVFNWLTLMSLFYHQPGDICPSSPPRLTVPTRGANAFMGDTFPRLCQFWTIVREIVYVYRTANGERSWGVGVSLPFAEFKFRELMAWCHNLPPHLLSVKKNSHHVHVMHLWLHAVILDIFRPFIGDSSQESVQLRTFSGKDNTPKAIVEASNARLRFLVVGYRLNYSPSTFTILWQTALIYVANDLIQHTEGENWYSYLLLCLYGYQRLSRSWRVARAISKALLSMAVRRTDIAIDAVHKLLADLESQYPRDLDEVRAPFPMDLDSEEEHDCLTVEHLAGQLQENMALREFTNIFDREMLN